MRSCYHQGCDSGSNPNLRKSDGIKFLAKTAQAVTLAVAELAGGLEGCDLLTFFGAHQSPVEDLPESPIVKLPEVLENVENFLEKKVERLSSSPPPPPVKKIEKFRPFVEQDSSENFSTSNEDFESPLKNVNRKKSNKSSVKKTDKDSNLGPEALIRFLLSNYLTKAPRNFRNDPEPEVQRNPEIFSDEDLDTGYEYEDQVSSHSSVSHRFLANKRTLVLYCKMSHC